ncbi:hypothetical protein [Cerasicoccus fimbriatus]|uniref:hypothetical protein n=1 Tax=Cerasicoccus fimbriatus TaxID=3014554 RepID=UPI0022B4C679|nr:hypothetical protein [Cerasicoccus sp. TK19100]
MFFRRKSKPPQIIPFNQRVTAFWQWYAAEAQRFYDTIEDKRCPELAKEVSAKVNQLLPGMAWVFGPGPKEQGGHSFTLSPEGNAHKRLLSDYWLAQAPKLPGWTFYASRQPSHTISAETGINIKDLTIKAGETWVSAHPQRDNQIINLSAWHPSFEELPEKAAYQITFIMLDEALGEDAVENHIGEIHIRNDRLANSVPMHELRDEVEKIRAKWEDAAPHGSYQVYQLPEPSDRFLRADTIAGSTRHMKLINEYLGEEGQMADDPIAELGAEFAFVCFPSTHLPRGEEATKRGEIEDALEQALQPDQRGICLGGATGMLNTYVDLLLFDPGPETISRLQAALAPFQLNGDAALHPFYGNSQKPRCRL